MPWESLVDQPGSTLPKAPAYTPNATPEIATIPTGKGAFVPLVTQEAPKSPAQPKEEEDPIIPGTHIRMSQIHWDTVRPIDQREAIRLATRNSTDPIGDAAKYDAAQKTASILGRDPKWVYENSDAVQQALWGKVDEPRTWLQKVADIPKDAYLALEAGRLSWKMMLGDNSEETKTRYEAVKAEQKAEPFKIQDLPIEVVKALVGMGYQAFAGAKTIAGAVAYVASGEALSELMGKKSIFNFGEMTKEEASAFVGTFGGTAYAAMKDQGVDPEIAGWTTAGLIAFNAAMTALPVSKALGLDRVAEAAAAKTISTALLDGTVDGLAKKVAPSWISVVGKEMAKTAVEQTGFAFINSVVNTLAPEYAKNLTNLAKEANIPLASVYDLMKEIGIGTAQGALTMTALGTVSTVMSGTRLHRQMVAAAKDANAWTIRYETAKRYREAHPDLTPDQDMKVEAWMLGVDADNFRPDSDAAIAGYIEGPAPRQVEAAPQKPSYAQVLKEYQDAAVSIREKIAGETDAIKKAEYQNSLNYLEKMQKTVLKTEYDFDLQWFGEGGEKDPTLNDLFAIENAAKPEQQKPFSLEVQPDDVKKPAAPESTQGEFWYARLTPEQIKDEADQLRMFDDVPDQAPVKPPDKPSQVIEQDVASLKVQERIPNMKLDTDETGTRPEDRLKSKKFDKDIVRPILVYEFADGTREVASGRHRTELAKRTGEATIPAQLFKEADGWTVDDMVFLDAKSNIQEGGGNVHDYSNFFHRIEVSLMEADEQGLLATKKGRDGYAIGTYASEGLYSAYQDPNGPFAERKNADAEAAIIARGAPQDPGAQRAGMQYLFAEKPDLQTLETYMELQSRLSNRSGSSSEQPEIFGDEIFKDSKKVSEAVAEIRKELAKKKADLNALKSLSGKRKGTAEEHSVRVAEEEQAKIVREKKEVDAEIAAWEKPWDDPARMAIAYERAGVSRESKVAQLNSRAEVKKEPAKPTKSLKQQDILGAVKATNAEAAKPPEVKPETRIERPAEKVVAKPSEAPMAKLFGVRGVPIADTPSGTELFPRKGVQGTGEPMTPEQFESFLLSDPGYQALKRIVDDLEAKIAKEKGDKTELRRTLVDARKEADLAVRAKEQEYAEILRDAREEAYQGRKVRDDEWRTRMDQERTESKSWKEAALSARDEAWLQSREVEAEWKDALRSAREEAHLEDRMRKSIWDSINHVNSMIRDIQRIDTRRMGDETKAMVNKIMAAFTTVKHKDATIAELRDLAAKLKDDPNYAYNCDIPKWKLNALRDLDKKPLREMGEHELEIIHDALMDYVELDRTNKAILVAEREMEKEQAVEDSIGEMPPVKKLLERKLQSGQTIGEAIRHKPDGLKDLFGIDILNYDILVGLMGPTAERVLFKQLYDGDMVHLKKLQTWTATFEDSVAPIVKKHRNFSGWMSEKKTYGGLVDTQTGQETPPLALTRGERIAFGLHMANPKNAAHITTGGIGFRDKRRYRDRIFQIPEGVVNTILQDLSKDPDEMAYIVAAQGLLRGVGKELDSTFYKINNFRLMLEEPYWPLSVMPAARGTDAESDMQFQLYSDWARIGLVKGMLKDRTDSKAAIYLDDVASVLNRSLEASAAYIGLEEPLRNASKLLFDPTWSTAVKNRYGETFYRNVVKGVKDIARMREQYGALEDGLMWLRNKFAVGLVGFPNPWPIVKQATGLLRYGVYIEPQYLVAGASMAGVRPRKTDKFLSKWSPQFASRGEGGYSREVADVRKEGAVGKAFGGKESLGSKLMKPLQAMDKQVVMSGMLAAIYKFDHEAKKGKLSPIVKEALGITDADLAGMDQVARMEAAMKFGDVMTYRTQNMGLPEFQSTLQRGGAVSKLVTLFMSEKSAAENLKRRLYFDMKQKKSFRSAARFINGSIILLAIEPAMNVLVGQLRNLLEGEENEDVKKDLMAQMMAEPFQALPIFSTVASDAARGAVLGRPSGSLSIMAVQQVFDSGIQAINYLTAASKAKSAEKRNKYLLAAADHALEVVGPLASIPWIPLRSAGKIAQNALGLKEKKR